MTLEADAGRIEQLREGMAGAGASLPPAHAELGSRAVEAAGRVSALASALVGPDGAGAAEGAEERLSAAVELLEALHYDLCRISILRDDPEALEARERVERTERLAGDLEALLPAGAPAARGGGSA